MASRDRLGEFVRDGLVAGQTPDELAAALAAAGWSRAEIDAALSVWRLDARLGVPVPRPRAYVSARDAVVYGLLFVALGNTIWATGALGFDIIGALIRDPGEAVGWQPSGMRYSMAQLIVFLPAFLWLHRHVGRAQRRDPGQRRSLVRKWLAAVAILVAMVVLLGDAAASIRALLDGEMTARFAARAGLVAVLGLLVMAYLRGDVDAR